MRPESTTTTSGTRKASSILIMIDSLYKVFCTESSPLPTERQVTELEKRIGVSLPEDYRQLILEYNGGMFSEAEIAPQTEDVHFDASSP